VNICIDKLGQYQLEQIKIFTDAIERSKGTRQLVVDDEDGDVIVHCPNATADLKTGDIVANLNANLKRGVADDLKKSNADVELKKVDGDVDLKKVDTEVELKRADVELKIACFSSQLIASAAVFSAILSQFTSEFQLLSSLLTLPPCSFTIISRTSSELLELKMKKPNNATAGSSKTKFEEESEEEENETTSVTSSEEVFWGYSSRFSQIERQSTYMMPFWSLTLHYTHVHYSASEL
ncbi:hypothetical protein CUMW_206760, partial [Citrus unshiu]